MVPEGLRVVPEGFKVVPERLRVGSGGLRVIPGEQESASGVLLRLAYLITSPSVY